MEEMNAKLVDFALQYTPYNINAISTRYVKRIKKNINLGIIS